MNCEAFKIYKAYYKCYSLKKIKNFKIIISIELLDGNK